MAQDEEKEGVVRQETSRRHKWLVMIYLAGDNNLSANCLAILQELEDAEYAEDVLVLACFDSNTPRPRGARYFEIHRRRHQHDPNPAPFDWALHDDLLPFDGLPDHPVQAPDFCNPEPGSVNVPQGPVTKEGLSRFLKFALDNYKDYDRRILILYGHGSAVAGNTFLADDNPPSFLRLKDFKEVLSRHFGSEHAPGQQTEGTERQRKPMLDILACDNCMMNGIESAYQIRRQVKYVIGSQGLMLALGWPFKKVINSIVGNRREHPVTVAGGMLEACARSLMDFALMERSSDQSLCDLTTLSRWENLVTAANELSAAMQAGLDYKNEVNPAVRDAIRLARLEAQSYWSETFVDLYDFCALLYQKCNYAVSQVAVVLKQLQFENASKAAKDELKTEVSVLVLRDLPFINPLWRIAEACAAVMAEIKPIEIDPSTRGIAPAPVESDPDETRFVLSSYYVGSELQYSNGVSVYFPWTLPQDPIIFEPVQGGGGGGSYYLSWAKLDQVTAAREAAKKKAKAANPSGGNEPPDEYALETAFDEYKSYDFAGKDGGDWAAFLEAFFHATLRDVRRFEFNYFQSVYTRDKDTDLRFFGFKEDQGPFFDSGPVNLQKSSSDVDSETACVCPTIKNYPRRFYVSPADCCRRCDIPGACGDSNSTFKRDEEPCVSYFGWNVRGLAAKVINLPELVRKSSDAADDSSETKAGREPEGS